MNDKEMIEEMQRDCNCITMDEYCLVERMYNKNYRKIPENAVVLTREERDKILQATEYRINQLKVRIAVKENDIGKLESEIDDLKYELKQARKETAREIFDKLIALCKESRIFFAGDEIKDDEGILYLEDLEDLAKQYGVDLGE